MNLSTREELLGSFQRRFRDVPLPDGRSVRIRNLSELERGRLIEAPRLNAPDDAARRKAIREEPSRWIIACVVGESGDPLFTKDDVPELMQLDSATSRAIYVAAQEHVGSIPAVEELEKNSDGTSGGSSS